MTANCIDTKTSRIATIRYAIGSLSVYDLSDRCDIADSFMSFTVKNVLRFKFKLTSISPDVKDHVILSGLMLQLRK